MDSSEGRTPPVVLLITVFLVFAAGIYWLVYQSKDHRHEYAARLIKLNIRGRVRAISHNRGETYLFLDSVANPFFIPVESGLGGQEFASYAQKGDSVQKPPHSQVIKVKKPRQIERIWRLGEGYY